MASRRAAPSPTPPPLPPRPPLRSRRKSKSPSSRSAHSTPKRALDLDQIEAGNGGRAQKGPRDPRPPRGSELDANWEDVTLELRRRGGRTRSGVYQTSDLPSMVKAKRQAGRAEGPARTDRTKVKATFV